MLWFCYTCGNDVIAEYVVVISQYNGIFHSICRLSSSYLSDNFLFFVLVGMSMPQHNSQRFRAGTLCFSFSSSHHGFCELCKWANEGHFWTLHLDENKTKWRLSSCKITSTKRWNYYHRQAQNINRTVETSKEHFSAWQWTNAKQRTTRGSSNSLCGSALITSTKHMWISTLTKI